MAASSLLSLFLLLILTSPTTATSNDTPINISLSIFLSHSLQTLEMLDSIASLIRTPFPKSRNYSLSTTLVDNYGIHLLPLSFGTPPQTFHLIFDTASSLVWIPCGSNHRTLNSSYPNLDPLKIPTFDPKESSSFQIVGCNNPKCWWVIGNAAQSQCENCKFKHFKQACSQACPSYAFNYVSGSTVGTLMLETLKFPGQNVHDFLVGCSSLSIGSPFGIVGFNRGLESFPSQMGLEKFSYCLANNLLPRKLKNSYLVLNEISLFRQLSYTPFHLPVLKKLREYYYYVILEKIIVGHKEIDIPNELLVPGSDGTGGTIMDSGTTLTYMRRSIFDVLVWEFSKQVSKVMIHVGSMRALDACFKIRGKKLPATPKLTFQFKGGAKMKLSWRNYLVMQRNDVACLSIVTDNTTKYFHEQAIILGNVQQRGFHMEFDLKQERLGFRASSCL